MTGFSRNTKSEFPAPDLSGGGEMVVTSEPPRRNPLAVVWQRRWIVAGTIALSLILATIHLFRATRVYQATSKLTVERTGPRIITNDPSADFNQASNFLNTQCEVIKSRKILQAVAEMPQCADMESFAENPGNMVSMLKKMVSAEVGRKDDVIKVSVRTPVSKDAPVLANAVVDAYIADQNKRKTTTVKDLLAYFQKEKVRVDEHLDKKRTAKLEFQKKYADLSVGTERVNPMMDRLQRLSSALTEIQLEVLNDQAALDATKAMASEPQRVKQLLESRTFRSENAELRRQLRELQQRFVGMGSKYLPNFPDVTLIQGSIKQLNDELATEDKKTFDAYMAELDARLTTAQNSERQLQALLNEARAQVRSLSGALAELGVLQAEVEQLEKYQAGIAMRIQELSPLTDDAQPVNSVNMIEDARPIDTTQVEPQITSTLFNTLMSALALGVVLAFVRDWIDQRLRSADEIRQLTGLPILGVVPHIHTVRTASQRGLQLHLDPMSDVAESYRTIRTAVYFGVPAGSAKTLLITSPAPGDGKTTLASNLAIAMAQAGNRVLLLDADFRKPMQHKIFELEKTTGLSNVLAGEGTLSDAIHPTMIPGLDVLACGPVPANPSEVLNSQMFADILERLSAKYDHVLLDSPPVMPVTDARILAASCDATLLALRAEKSTRKAAIFARDVLNSVGARLLGVVVNDVPRRKGLYGYYYSEGEMYQYGYGARRSRSNGAGQSESKPGAQTPALQKH
ncbi:MAG: GumC family protein [Tepidisphaeraceae bacterium]